MLEARAHGYMCCLASISEFQHFKTTWSNGRKVCFGFGCWKGSTYIMTCNQFHNWSGVVDLLVLPQTKSTTGFERWFALFKGVNFTFHVSCVLVYLQPIWARLSQSLSRRQNQGSRPMPQIRQKLWLGEVRSPTMIKMEDHWSLWKKRHVKHDAKHKPPKVLLNIQLVSLY